MKMATKPKKDRELSFEIFDDVVREVKASVSNDWMIDPELPDGEGELKEYAAYIITGNDDYYPKNWPNKFRDFNGWTYRGRLVRAATALLFAGFRLDEEEQDEPMPKQNPIQETPDVIVMENLPSYYIKYNAYGKTYLRSPVKNNEFIREDVYDEQCGKNPTKNIEFPSENKVEIFNAVC